MRFATVVLVLASACGQSEMPTAPTPSLVPLSSVPSGARAFENAPPWAGEVEPLPMRADGEPSTVPQVRDLESVASVLGTQTGETRGVLVCEIVVAPTRAYDEAAFVGMGAPDISAYVRIAGGPEARARIAEDTFRGTITLPNVTLAPNAQIAIRLRDRDVGGDEPIAEASAAWTGRLSLSNDRFSARCGLLPYDAAKERGGPALSEAMQILAMLERSPREIDLVNAPLLVFTETESARAAIREAASFLGYVHPDVARALTRLARFETARLGRYRAELERVYRTASAPGAEARVSEKARVAIRGFACPPSADLGFGPRCRIAVQTIATQPAEPLGPDALALRVLLRDDVSAVCLTDTSDEGEPIANARWVVCRMPRLPAEDEPLLLQVNQAGAAVLVRAR